MDRHVRARRYRGSAVTELLMVLLLLVGVIIVVLLLLPTDVRRITSQPPAASDEPTASQVTAPPAPPAPPPDAAPAAPTVRAIKLPRWAKLVTDDDGGFHLQGTPGADDVGDHEVILEVSAAGGKTRQAYTLHVESAIQPPVITSEPITHVKEGAAYSYAIRTFVNEPVPDDPPPALSGAALVARAMLLLQAHCFGCHNPQKMKGDLNLMTRQTALTLPALVSGNADASRMIQVLAADAEIHMPPKKQLADADIATLRAWINDGAAWVAEAMTAPPDDEALAQLVGLPKDYRPVMSLALSGDGKRLAVGRGNVIAVHDVSETERPMLAKLQGHAGVVRSLGWSPDGQWLASGGYRRIVIWHVESMQQHKLIDQLDGQITALAFSPDGSTLVAADGQLTKDSVIRAWSLPDTEPKEPWSAHQDTVFDLAISGDGKLLATAGADNLVKLWDMATGEQLAKLDSHGEHVMSLAFNPDGKRLASGGADRVVKVWDVETYKETRNISGYESAVTAITWTKEGDKIIVACEDGKLRVGNEKKGIETTFETVGQVLYAVAAADPNTIYGGAHDGTVYIWSGDGKIQGKLEPDDSE